MKHFNDELYIDCEIRQLKGVSISINKSGIVILIILPLWNQSCYKTDFSFVFTRFKSSLILQQLLRHCKVCFM